MSIRITISIIALLSLFLFIGGYSPAEEKINGVSMVGAVEEVGSESLHPIKQVNANWVCLIPFAFGSSDATTLTYNADWQWWGEKKEGIIAGTKNAHNLGLKVMIKPQIWFRHGYYVGHYDAKTKEEWQAWEQNYENYILEYAQIAESQKAEMFCIGTEFTKFVEERPAFWSQLINKVRKVYSGKITYAANWDAYQRFPHWKELDFIGIDAYFPLDNAHTPNTDALIKAWEKDFQKIRSLYNKTKVPIIFTEFGYRSVDQTAHTPWVSDNSTKVNHEAQHNAYEAIFQKFWCEDWFGGGFLWNWYNHHDGAGGNDTDYTPQNKPAEILIKEWYERY